jgi:hypothetical protein
MAATGYRYRNAKLTTAVLRISVTFWYGSGSADQYLCLTDSYPDPHPANFVSDL